MHIKLKTVFLGGILGTWGNGVEGDVTAAPG
jgi:hypothetical protein